LAARFNRPHRLVPNRSCKIVFYLLSSPPVLNIFPYRQVHGTFGSGKSVLIVAIIVFLHRVLSLIDPDNTVKILVSALTNVAGLCSLFFSFVDLLCCLFACVLF
jgi:hypothetical protein